jgi:hypothetical protein
MHSPSQTDHARANNVVCVTGVHGAKLATDLLEFYALADNFDILKVVNGSSPPVSLRSIAIYVSLAADEPLKRGYMLNLRKFTRKRFDPFRRCDRVELESPAGSVVTTEGQMNFFRWLVESGYWSFIIDNSVNVIAAATRCARDSAPSHARKSSSSVTCRGKNVVPSGVSTVAGRHVVIFD